MKYINIAIASLFAMLLFSVACPAQTYSGATGNSSQSTVSCAATGSYTVAVSASGTNTGWTIHPESASVRIQTRIPGVTPPLPTFEITSGNYVNSTTLGTNPTLEIDCASETSSPVTADIWVNNR